MTKLLSKTQRKAKKKYVKDIKIFLKKEKSKGKKNLRKI